MRIDVDFTRVAGRPPMRMKMVLGVLPAVLALGAIAPGATSAAVVAHWPLDEGSGTVAHDASGNDNHGTVLGSAAWQSGRFGQALAFDGTTARISVPRATSLEPQSPTVMAWVKRSGSPGNFKTIVAKGASGCTAASYGLYTGPRGGLQFYVSDSAGIGYSRSPAAPSGVWDGNWHHVAGSFDGTAVRLFVDGVEVGSGTPRTAPIDYGALDSRDLFVGHYDGCGGAIDYDGAADDVRVYDRALTGGEIQAAMTRYSFEGFYSPVNNPSTLNVVKAGSGVPVKFSLGGDRGLAIFANASPSSSGASCDTSAPVDALEETMTAGDSYLSYDPSTDQYTYVWKTAKSWAGTCRRLTVALADGTAHTALFRFR